MMSAWEEKNDKLAKIFHFNDFNAAMVFVNQVGKLAEEKQHHPDILINYNKVSLTLSTHDAGNKVTVKDREMAVEIDKII